MTSQDLKALVADGYNRCADAYAAARSDSPSHELVSFADRLTPRSTVLDVGCGCGSPVTRFLASRFEVTGVDISVRQIALARRNAPSARLICADIMAQGFSPATFDAIVISYALFHLPRAEHDRLIANMSLWMKVGGFAFVTVAAVPEELGMEEDFFGSRMYWSGFAPAAYVRMFATCGFRVLETGALGSGFSQALQLPEESHPFFILQRGAGDT